jgi:hypothetical protein
MFLEKADGRDCTPCHRENLGPPAKIGRFAAWLPQVSLLAASILIGISVHMFVEGSHLGVPHAPCMWMVLIEVNVVASNPTAIEVRHQCVPVMVLALAGRIQVCRRRFRIGHIFLMVLVVVIVFIHVGPMVCGGHLVSQCR